MFHLVLLSTKFLSTPSARRATGYFPQSVGQFLISIHALCEEGDASSFSKGFDLEHFYPRPLRGGRLG